MPRKPIEIAGETFKTQTAAIERIRGIMASYHNGATVNMFDLAFLQDLLRRHPDAESKIGIGVASIFVDRNPQYPSTRTFFLVRVDGSSTDFSFMECLRPTPHDKKVLRAFRAAVEPYTLQFKRDHFDRVGEPAICPITGESIRFVGSHVDHAAPMTFEALAAAFLAGEGLTPEDVAVAETADHTYYDRLTDPDLEQRWIDFHNARAVLRVVSRPANLSTLRYGDAGK